MVEEKKSKQVEKSQPVTKSSKAEQAGGVKKDAVVSAGQQLSKQGVQPKKKVFKGKSRGGFRSKTDRPQEEFEQRIIDIARVTRVMAGGKRMRFRACVAIGDKKGRVAIGLAKGKDVTIAATKAVSKAKKNIITVPMVNNTIPHEVYQKFGAAKILFKPARKGRGIIAGGAVRIVLELSGIKNVTSKILGTNNKVNNVKCTIEALKSLKRVESKKNDKSKKENIEFKEVKSTKFQITNNKQIPNSK